MKNGILLIAALLVSLGLAGQNYSDSLTIALEKHSKSSELPGFSVAIVNQNQVLYQKSFGFANKEKELAYKTTTLQNLGSVSKTFVGLALTKAIEDGKLDLDTPINAILPFEVTNPYYPDTPILIRHLANHTSTILDTNHYGKSYILDDSFTDNENIHRDFLGFIKGHPAIELNDFLFKILNKEGDWYRKKNFLKAKPHSTKEYSNLNAALMAYIIEIATDMPFKAYCQAKIFKPLGMNATSWSLEKEHASRMATPYFPSGNQVPAYRLITYPDGGLISNTEDLSNYLREMIKAYTGKSTYLKPELAKIMLPGDADNNRAFWGMGQKSRNIGHGGSDPETQTDVQFNADNKLGRIVLTNVNAEDNEALWQQFRSIHTILAKYEQKLLGQ